MRVVLTRDTKGKARAQALFCTDPRRSVIRILAGYAKRWSLEVAFFNAKQAMGPEDPQYGWWRRLAGCRPKKKRHGPQPGGRRGEQAVLHTVPLAFVAYGLVLVWCLRHGNPQRDVARARRQAPWYRRKQDPSCWDMLAALRRRILVERVSADPLPRQLRRKALRLFPQSLLAA